MQTVVLQACNKRKPIPSQGFKVFIYGQCSVAMLSSVQDTGPLSSSKALHGTLSAVSRQLLKCQNIFHLCERVRERVGGKSRDSK